MWFLDDPGLLSRERDAVEKLQDGSAWLDGVHWQLDVSGIRLDCVIIVGPDKAYPIRLQFPDHYSSVPPSVEPLQPERLSDHQYIGGELCLELGPDNWNPGVHLSAHLLESAHRLLSLEAEHDEDPATEIPSRHALTAGQQYRTAKCRFVITDNAKSAMNALPAGSTARASFTMMFHQDPFIMFLAKMEAPGSEDWVDPDLPAGLKRIGSTAPGIVVADQQGGLTLATLTDAKRMNAFLDELDIPEPSDAGKSANRDDIRFVALREFDDQWTIYGRWHSDDKVSRLTTVSADSADPEIRHGLTGNDLATKTVAIVGMGSAGSKIATSLARSGVGNFILLDDDILHPSNLVRHDSDWIHVGQHKVDAVADRLEFISPKIKTVRHKHRLAGQEAATSAASALAALGKADLIVDATANPKVFNLCAHVARQSKTPLLWFEIYAGGIGGLVARTRPTKDAEPFTLRQAIYDVASDIANSKGVDPPEPVADYAMAAPDDQIVTASDSDVGLIATSATSMALDVLLEREPSAYPAPAYLIGLKRDWIFDQPFHVFPVECTGNVDWSKPVDTDDESRSQGAEFIKQLIMEFSKNGGDSNTK